MGTVFHCTKEDEEDWDFRTKPHVQKGKSFFFIGKTLYKNDLKWDELIIKIQYIVEIQELGCILYNTSFQKLGYSMKRTRINVFNCVKQFATDLNALISKRTAIHEVGQHLKARCSNVSGYKENYLSKNVQQSQGHWCPDKLCRLALMWPGGIDMTIWFV